MTKTQILINKTVYLGLSILDLSKTIMYEFWYDYVKLKYGEKAKLCYMDTNSFTVHVNTNDVYKDIAEDIETKFESSKRIFWKEYETKSWQLIIRLEINNYNTILTEKQQKYQHYHQVKLINMNILQAQKYYLLIKAE